MSLCKRKLSRQKVIYVDRNRKMVWTESNKLQARGAEKQTLVENVRTKDKTTNLRATGETLQKTKICDSNRKDNTIKGSRSNVKKEEQNEHNEALKPVSEIVGNDNCGNVTKTGASSGENDFHKELNSTENHEYVNVEGVARPFKVDGRINGIEENNNLKFSYVSSDYKEQGDGWNNCRENKDAFSWRLPRNGNLTASVMALNAKPLLAIDPFSDAESVLSTEVNSKEYFQKLKEFEKEIRQPGKPDNAVVTDKRTRRCSDPRVCYYQNQEDMHRYRKPQVYRCSSVSEVNSLGSGVDTGAGVGENVENSCGNNTLSAALEDIIQDFLNYFQIRRLSVSEEGNASCDGFGGVKEDVETVGVTMDSRSTEKG